MAIVVELPRLSDTMEEGVVAEWRIAVGDQARGIHIDNGDVLHAFAGSEGCDEQRRLGVGGGVTTGRGSLMASVGMAKGIMWGILAPRSFHLQARFQCCISRSRRRQMRPGQVLILKPPSR